MAFACCKRNVRDTNAATLHKAKLAAIAFTLLFATAAFGLGVAYTRITEHACTLVNNEIHKHGVPADTRPIVFAFTMSLLTLICIDIHIFCYFSTRDKPNSISTDLIALGAYGILCIGWIIQIGAWSYSLQGKDPVTICFDTWASDREYWQAYNILFALDIVSCPVFFGCVAVAGLAGAQSCKETQARNALEHRTAVLDDNSML